MTTNDHTARLAREARAIHAACEGPAGNIGALEFHDEPRDRLSSRLAQAEAMILATFGAPGEGWRQLAPHVQDAYLWGAWDLIRAARGDLAILDAEGADRAAGGKS
jgi:hypothetical protein